MYQSRCSRCGTHAETLAPSGLCETCLSESDATILARTSAAQQLNTRTADDTRTPPAAAGFGRLPHGGYRYVERLGGGGMGVVFRAVQLATDRTVAVKRLLPHSCTPGGMGRFVAEAKAISAVDHDNVVRVFDFVPDPADPLLVMEYVPGRPLSVVLKEDGPLPPDRAAEVIAAAARGVQAAHDAGVIHRDLKPDNLLVTPDGKVKVADFGLGKRVDAPEGVTVPGQVVGGTPGFMAPEQVDGQYGEPGKPADVWGLGACLYAAVTGKSPFPSGRGAAHRAVYEPVVPPRRKNRRVPPALEAIILACLKKDPAERYPSAGAVADDLERFRQGASTVARPLPWVVQAWRQVRSTPRAVAAAWLVALLGPLAVGIAVASIPRPSEETPEQVHARWQKRYAAGETVTAVPKAGLPVWKRWILGRAEITDSPDDDGAAYLTPGGTNTFTVFDPPGESYTASFDLKHRTVVDAIDPETKVGVVLFHERFADARVTVDRYLTVSWADYDVEAWHDKPDGWQPVHVVFWYVIHDTAARNTYTSTSALRMYAHRLDAGRTVPGKWRRVVAEVTPAGVRLLWAADADATDADPQPFASFSAAQLHAKCKRHREEAARKHTLPDSLPPVWNPAGGVGVWAVRSGLSFRNVTILSTTP
jgi:Protein kinase domain